MTGNTLRTGGQPTANEPLQVPTVRLIDCQGLTYAFEMATSASAGVATHPVATKYEALPVTGGVITLFYPDGTRAMMVEFPYNGEPSEKNFETQWDSANDCAVFYRPSLSYKFGNLISPVKKFLKSKTGIYLSGVVTGIILMFFIGWIDVFLYSEKAAEAADCIDSVYVEEVIPIVEEVPAEDWMIEAEADAKVAALAQVKAEYAALIAKLGNINVTKADLDRVIAYQNEHKDEQKAEIAANRAKVRAYKSFFDPSQSFKKDIKYFSSAQQQACKYYFYIKGNDPKRDFNYALKKAMEMGLVD